MTQTDAFKDRLSARARDSSRPALAHQCRGRELTEKEMALAEGLMAAYGAVGHDFAKVVAELSARGVAAPKSGRTDWDEALLADELKAINADLDAAYAEQGYGA